MPVEYCENVNYEIAVLGAVKTELISGLRKGLARKSRAKYVMGWNILQSDLANISMRP